MTERLPLTETRDVNPRRSASQVLHFGDAADDRVAALTYCGRLRDEVLYWATPEIAANMTFAPPCGTCAASLRRRVA